MKTIVLLKRVLFWLESSVSLLIVLVGAAILLYVVVAGLVLGEMGTWLREVGELAAYFATTAIRIAFENPLVLLGTVFWVGVYIGTMIYFAQTELEKRILKYLIPLTLACLPIGAFAGFTMVLGALASQGAGQ